MQKRAFLAPWLEEAFALMQVQWIVKVNDGQPRSKRNRLAWSPTKLNPLVLTYTKIWSYNAHFQESAMKFNLCCNIYLTNYVTAHAYPVRITNLEALKTLASSSNSRQSPLLPIPRRLFAKISITWSRTGNHIYSSVYFLKATAPRTRVISVTPLIVWWAHVVFLVVC